MSFKMLDTYREVLLRKEYPEALVEEEISALVDMMKFGPAGFDPHIVLGGSPDPALKDIEDGGVLATAYAAHAGILITDNLKDFAGQIRRHTGRRASKRPTAKRANSIVSFAPDQTEENS